MKKHFILFVSTLLGCVTIMPCLAQQTLTYTNDDTPVSPPWSQYSLSWVQPNSYFGPVASHSGNLMTVSNYRKNDLAYIYGAYDTLSYSFSNGFYYPLVSQNNRLKIIGCQLLLGGENASTRGRIAAGSAKNANGNILEIKDSKITNGWIYAGYGLDDMYWSETWNGMKKTHWTANNNVLIIENSTIHGEINVARGSQAKGNTLIIRNSSISGGWITKGVVYVNSVEDLDNIGIHNTATLEGDTYIDNIFSGISSNSQRMVNDGSTGNTLNIVRPGINGIVVTQSVTNFEYYNFVLPAKLPTGGTGALLQCKYTWFYASSDNAMTQNSKIRSISLGENTNVQVGDVVKLISVQDESFSAFGTNAGWTDGLNTDTIIVTDDGKRKATWNVRVSGKILEAELTAVESTSSDNFIDKTNKGGFDITTNVPVDSIEIGTLSLAMPEGFKLDQTATKLAVGLEAYELIVSPTKDNEWKLTIREKETRSSVQLKVAAGRTLAHIAYTVDNEVQNGIYYMTVEDIRLTASGGSVISDPSFTIPVTVERWSVGNEDKVSTETELGAAGNSLFIRTPQSAMLSVYTLTGRLYKQQRVDAGNTNIPLPQGMYIVKAGKVTQKLIIK